MSNGGPGGQINLQVPRLPVGLIRGAVLGVLGAFFALFTRSTFLAAFAALAYALPAFLLVPAGRRLLKRHLKRRFERAVERGGQQRRLAGIP